MTTKKKLLKKKQIFIYNMIKLLLLEANNEEIVLDFLKEKIRGTEWENRLYLAGGAVRDEIMGLKPKDLDFLVLGDIDSGIKFSEWLANLIGNYKKNSNPVIYPRFGTAKLSLKNNNSNLSDIELEFVAPRKETYVSGSRKPEVVAGELKDDALRRDLTINSLLKNISTNEIVDISGNGVNDIKKGIIRTTSEPDIIFKDDPLRMLRAIRFAVKYNFNVDESVINGIKKHADKITYISKERISDELNKILLTKNPSEGIRLLEMTGLLKYVLEEFQKTIGMTQNVYHKDDVFGHTLSVLSNTPPDLKTRLIALFHDIGKTVTKTISPDGTVHFYGHEDASEKIVRQIMTRLKYPKELIDAVASGVKYHMYLKHGEDDTSKLSDKTLRKFKAAVGDNLEHVLDAIHADNISHADDKSMKNQINIIRQRLKDLNDKISPESLKLPLNGNDIKNIMGVKDGPLIGKVKDAIQDAWYENPNLSREDAIEIVKSFMVKQNINEIKTMIKKILNIK